MDEDDDDLPPWPEHLLASNHPPRTWSSRSDATWEAIRQDYLAGVSARDLCDRYDVALSTLRLRAKDGGWRRADQADSDLFPADADRWVADPPPQDEPPAGEETWADLADQARFRLRRAIAAGRATEAASWLRVHDRLRALAAAEDPPPVSKPDPLDAVSDVAAEVRTLALRAARATDPADIAALEAEIDALQSRLAAPALDSLDSLDPVFSGGVDETGTERGFSP